MRPYEGFGLEALVIAENDRTQQAADRFDDWRTKAIETARLHYIRGLLACGEEAPSLSEADLRQELRLAEDIARRLMDDLPGRLHDRLAEFCRWLKSNGHEPAADALWAQYEGDRAAMAAPRGNGRI